MLNLPLSWLACHVQPLRHDGSPIRFSRFRPSTQINEENILNISFSTGLNQYRSVGPNSLDLFFRDIEESNWCERIRLQGQNTGIILRYTLILTRCTLNLLLFRPSVEFVLDAWWSLVSSSSCSTRLSSKHRTDAGDTQGMFWSGCTCISRVASMRTPEPTDKSANLRGSVQGSVVLFCARKLGVLVRIFKFDKYVFIAFFF